MFHSLLNWNWQSVNAKSLDMSFFFPLYEYTAFVLCACEIRIFLYPQNESMLSKCYSVVGK